MSKKDEDAHFDFNSADSAANQGVKHRSLTESERHKLLVEWNQTKREYPRNSCVHELFEGQVERSPHATAVECEGQRLTYQQLNVCANRLAHYLRSLGVGPEALVGICVEPSLDMVIGLLGILKAGGAYVPLDPAYPKKRLALILEDTAMKVLVTQEKFAPGLHAGTARIVCMESHLPDSDAVLANPVSGVRPDNLVYIIYTSGSTGRPKGVMIPHRGLVNYLDWAVKAYEVETGTGAPVHSSISFDLTITGLFTPLLVGRSVHILPPELGLGSLGKALQRNENFSLVKITPAHLELLREQLNSEDATGRTRFFVVGGEALPGDSVNFWQDHAPGTILVNEYGPTETVVGCCVYFAPHGTRFESTIPIGRPIANTQLYVLDPDLRPVPIGDKGELYIGGDGLARGYLNLPELTAERFISNPFAGDDAVASARLYKTGDMVRYLPDGNLEFLGRIDHQTKIRGFRIEPAEIEAVLAGHPDVQGAVVMARENTAGSKFLAAYVIQRGQLTISHSEYRRFLREKLPDYMIPEVFMTMPAFPLTPNGKIDRQSLPAPERDSTIHNAYVSPQTEMERKMAELWQANFPLPLVGMDDNFFDLGGHSLLAVRLIAEINRALNVNLDVLTLFEHPTIATLMAALQDGKQAFSGSRLVSLESGGSGPPVVFLWTPMEVQRLAKLARQKQPYYVCEVPFSSEILKAAAQYNYKVFPSVAEMSAPYTAMIRASGLTGPCVLAGFSYGGVLAFEVAHQLKCHGIAVEAVFLFDSDMKTPEWERFKWHMWNGFQSGADYVWSKIRQRQTPKNQERAARLRASQAPPSPGPFLKASNWEFIDRIWKHSLKHYRPLRLATRGILFRAQQSNYSEVQNYDGCLGWRGLFADGLEIIEVPGDHFSMWKEPQIRTLGKIWDKSLEKLSSLQNIAILVGFSLLFSDVANGF